MKHFYPFFLFSLLAVTGIHAYCMPEGSAALQFHGKVGVASKNENRSETRLLNIFREAEDCIKNYLRSKGVYASLDINKYSDNARVNSSMSVDGCTYVIRLESPGYTQRNILPLRIFLFNKTGEHYEVSYNLSSFSYTVKEEIEQMLKQVLTSSPTMRALSITEFKNSNMDDHICSTYRNQLYDKLKGRLQLYYCRLETAGSVVDEPTFSLMGEFYKEGQRQLVTLYYYNGKGAKRKLGEYIIDRHGNVSDAAINLIVTLFNNSSQ